MSDTIKPGTRVKATLGESVIVGKVIRAAVEGDWVDVLPDGSAFRTIVNAPPWTVEVIEPAEVLVVGAWYMDTRGQAMRRGRGARTMTGYSWWSDDDTAKSDDHMVRPLTRLMPMPTREQIVAVLWSGCAGSRAAVESDADAILEMLGGGS